MPFLCSPESNINALISEGRHYSSEFTNGANIMTKNGYPLKVSTYPNGVSYSCDRLIYIS